MKSEANFFYIENLINIKESCDQIMPAFFVYILECTDRQNNKSLYTGSTKDIAVRIEQHRTGKGARFTRGKKLRLVYFETHLTRSDAMKREIEIKNLSTKKKQEIVAKFLQAQKEINA